MNTIVESAISSVYNSIYAFCKFISANDAGKTGGHQEGFYMPKNSIPIMFDSPGIKGANKDKLIKIKWQNDLETTSRFIYYGQGTRNEYRLTRFGKGFPFLTPDNVGDLFVLCQIETSYYLSYILQNDEDIEDFLSALNISASDTNKLIDKNNFVYAEDRLLLCFRKYLSTLKIDFPLTYDLAKNARCCYINSFNISDSQIISNPDEELLNWINTEYKLFKTIENDRYKEIITAPFSSVEELITFSNTILNRRKSRAGKSLEHHLSEMFNIFNIQYESQIITEVNKKPDFIFPKSLSYHNPSFPDNKLFFLASKTTCKDRWRQILNEADRIKTKHLFTLQQGISCNQLQEMYNSDVCLVVPSPYITSFPLEFRSRILTLNSFIKLVKANQQ
jgi:hypothetical protein